MANPEFERIIELVGTEPALGRLIRTSQQHVNRLRQQDHVNANWAVRIHDALRAAFPEFTINIAVLCPDLTGWTPPARAGEEPPEPGEEGAA